MSVLSNLFNGSKKIIAESLSPSVPAEKSIIEPARGGTTLRKPEEAPQQPQKKAGPELSALEMAERQSWQVKSLPVRKKGDEILGLYLVEDVIETGGMGRVYIAHHKSWNVKLAIKSPNEMMLSDRNNFARVLREANSWTELGLHPNIAYCYYVRSIEEVPHIFVEYVDGGNLEQWIEEGKCIDYRVSLDLAIQFCHGMEWAHSKGMIHRDIKPKNILMTKDGVLKVTDFGLVRSGAVIGGGKANGGVYASGMTLPGIGTPGYMAPEQFEDPSGVDERADIFSFGVCLYEMCCGARPYDITIDPHQEAPDPIGLSRDKKFPPVLSEVLTKCVQWERGKRYGSFKEIRERLSIIYRGLYGKESPYTKIVLLDIEANGLNNRGVSYFDLGRKEDAISCWEQTLKIAELHLEATYNLSLLLWREAKIADDESLKRLEHCGNDPNIDKQKLSEFKAFIHAERLDFDAARDVLKEFPGRYEDLFSGKDVDQIGSVRTLEGHTSGVESVAVTSDGRYAVSGSSDKSVRVWELSSGLCVHNLEGHTGYVKTLAITPNGRYAVSGSSDNTLRVWELASGRCVHTLEGHTDDVTSVALTPDGQYAVSGCRSKNENTLRMWNLETGRCVRTLEGHTIGVDSIAITHNGQYAVSGRRDGNLLMWSLKTGRCVQTIERHTGKVHSVALTPDGRHAVSRSDDMTLRVWELTSGRCVRILKGHMGVARSVALTPNGHYIVSGNNDNTLRVLELTNGRCVRTIEGHNSSVSSVAITTDGRYAVSGSEDKTLRVWKIHFKKSFEAEFMVALPKVYKERKKEEDALERAIRQARSLFEEEKYRDSFSSLLKAWKDAKFINRVSVRSLYSDHLKKMQNKSRIKCLVYSFQNKVLIGHTREIFSVAFTPDGRYAVSGSYDTNLRIWDLETSRCVRTLLGHTDTVRSVAFTPDGRYAVSGSCDKTLRVWGLDDGRCVHTLEGHSGLVSSVAVTPDGKYAVSGSWDNTLRVWELTAGECVSVLESKENKARFPVDSLILSSDGRYAVTGNEDRVLVWELSTGQLVSTIEAREGIDMHLSPDGRYGAQVNVFGRLFLWETETGQLIGDMKGNCVAFTPDNRYVVSGGRNLKVLELATGQCIRTIDEPGGPSLAITPEGRYAISGSGDSSLRVWDLVAGKRVRTLERNIGDIRSIALSPDGRYVVIGKHEKSLRVWELIWDLDFPDPVDWDEGVRPYLNIFLTLRKGNWGEEDFKLLIDELASKRGYGWVRPEGVWKELEKMTREYSDSPRLP